MDKKCNKSVSSEIGKQISSSLSNTGRVDIFIVAFLENATIGYSIDFSVCVCVCVCVCVFCTITQKEIDLRTRNWNTCSIYK